METTKDVDAVHPRGFAGELEQVDFRICLIRMVADRTDETVRVAARANLAAALKARATLLRKEADAAAAALEAAN